jgi:hypothetical protein
MTSRFALPASIVCVGVVLTGAPLSGQTSTPHSAFSVTLIPQFQRQVWPGDFNRDGRTDLVGSAAPHWESARPTDLLISIARPDRSFPTPRSLGLAADAVAVSDFNQDGFQDLVVRTPTAFAVMQGNGNGTFRAARTVQAASADGPFPATVIVADFTGDGHRDIVRPERVGDNDVIRVHPGRGDFTFGTPLDTVVGYEGVMSMIAGDFNGDGRPDLAVATICPSIHILINSAGGGFAVSDVPISCDVADITAGDLDRDGDLDLVITQYFPLTSSPGQVGILLGTGTGGFGPPEFHEAGVKGEYTVVVADVTRDGILDVATGNQSTFYDDDLGWQLSDSMTVLRGTGDGGLEAPITFRLTYENEDFRYQNSQHWLTINDINRDGAPDLIGSPGAVLLSRSPVPNRAPEVFAGPDRTIGYEDGLSLFATARDPDGHWLDYRWTDATGRPIGSTPWRPLFGTLDIGTFTYTATVTDRLGGVASDSVSVRVTDYTDSISLSNPLWWETLRAGTPYVIRWFTTDVYSRFDLSYSPDAGRTFVPIGECTGLAGTVRECTWLDPGPTGPSPLLRIVGTGPGIEPYIDLSGPFTLAEGAPALPQGWQNRDVGAVGAPGRATFVDGTFTVAGSGADIWGTADEFHYAWRGVPSLEAMELTARVTFVGTVNQWTKAGIMLRRHLGPQAAHTSLFVTPSTVKGVAFQRRRADGGSSVHTAGPAITAPVWLKLVVTGASVRAYYRTDAGPWTLVGEDSTPGGFGGFGGLAVSSHVDGRLAEARFDNVSVRAIPSWTEQDIGAVGLAGSGSAGGLRVTLEASGADIWGTADAFRFRSTYILDTNVQMSARVASVENTNQWAKAGVMFRESLAPGARHVMLIVSPGRGVAMQYRAAGDGITANAALVPGAAPTWVRIRRTGQLFVGEISDDGGTWTEVGRVTLPIDGPIFEGIAVTSHNNRALATAVFEEVAVETLSPGAP